MKIPSYKPLYFLVYVVITIVIIIFLFSPYTWWDKLICSIVSIFIGAFIIGFIKFVQRMQEKFYDKFTKKRD
ncbi:hypothetical protein BACCIP111899_04239 [Bacillus rhizoplanae]|uniref:Uncharacterized protein n=1 Tax=Bacillus rhizoplanae TaxID=2880966 RepID=A0ABM8YH49_9BACI|nr:hypothetical protein BACCIP111899_04239 [Bacillus rhizoplanae]